MDKNPAQRADSSLKRMAAASGMIQTRHKSGPHLRGRGHRGLASRILPLSSPVPHVCLQKYSPLAHISPLPRSTATTGPAICDRCRCRPPTPRRQQAVRKNRTRPRAFVLCFRGVVAASEDAVADAVVLSPSRDLPPSAASSLPPEVSSRASCFQAASRPGWPLPAGPYGGIGLPPPARCSMK
jgi:hypothetical protein